MRKKIAEGEPDDYMVLSYMISDYFTSVRV